MQSILLAMYDTLCYHISSHATECGISLAHWSSSSILAPYLFHPSLVYTPRLKQHILPILHRSLLQTTYSADTIAILHRGVFTKPTAMARQGADMHVSVLVKV